MRQASLVFAALLLAAMGAGCTPVRTTIPPPYYMDGKKFETLGELEAEAYWYCAVNADGPRPSGKFTTDGCSAYPENAAVRACCIKHDVAYWCGARHRIEADREFRSCLREASSRFNAALMFAAVRLGGGRFSPFPWRFGYGFPWPHRKPLSPASVISAAPSEPSPQTPPTTP